MRGILMGLTLIVCTFGAARADVIYNYADDNAQIALDFATALAPDSLYVNPTVSGTVTFDAYSWDGNVISQTSLKTNTVILATDYQGLIQSWYIDAYTTVGASYCIGNVGCYTNGDFSFTSVDNGGQGYRGTPALPADVNPEGLVGLDTLTELNNAGPACADAICWQGSFGFLNEWNNITYTASTDVPEPSSLVILGGLLGLSGLHRFKTKPPHPSEC